LVAGKKMAERANVERWRRIPTNLTEIAAIRFFTDFYFYSHSFAMKKKKSFKTLKSHPLL
jgi:hypothetical protein